MKRLHEFLQCVLVDLGRWCCTSTSQDLKTVLARVDAEGISFLTITLSDFGKDFERSLDSGVVDPQAFLGFKRKAGLPAFLQGFLGQVFDSSGRLLDDPSVTAIWAVRQFTLMFAKMKLPTSKERTAAAIGRYVDCEQEVRATQARLWGPELASDFDRSQVSAQPHEVVAPYRRLATLLWADTLVDVERKLLAVPSQIIPRHGPGSTAELTFGNDKWVQQEWTDRLDQVFPAGEHLVSSWSFLPEAAGVRHIEPGAERPVRVITVPKSLKTPRIIAIEPVRMQYMQQGLLAAIHESLQQDDICWGFVGWGSQVPNQHLASKGSRDNSLATLDLSEASDRVSNQHVRDLLRVTPSLREAVDSCRSRTADVPLYGREPLNKAHDEERCATMDGYVRVPRSKERLTLAKFASMGSALCFPFEAMVFLTVVFAGIEKQRGRPLTRKDLKSFRGQVRVYGDDIIVPVHYVRSVVAELELHGFKVNTQKSFWTGKFRESCGKEYYNGSDVSIVRLRSEFPSSLRNGSEILSTVSTRNQLYKAGMWESARYLDTLLHRVTGVELPCVSEESPIVGRHSFLGPDLGSGRLDKDTHRPLVRGFRASAILPVSPLDGYGALLKCLTRLEIKSPSPSREVDDGLPNRSYDWFLDDSAEKPSAEWNPESNFGTGVNIWKLQVPDGQHLHRSGRPQSVNIKIGWASST